MRGRRLSGTAPWRGHAPEPPAATRPELAQAVAAVAARNALLNDAPDPGNTTDPIASPARLETAVRAAVAAGATVEYRALPNQGHLLTVPAALPEVVPWLLEKRREGGVRPVSIRPSTTR